MWARLALPPSRALLSQIGGLTVRGSALLYCCFSVDSGWQPDALQKRRMAPEEAREESATRRVFSHLWSLPVQFFEVTCSALLKICQIPCPAIRAL